MKKTTGKDRKIFVVSLLLLCTGSVLADGVPAVVASTEEAVAEKAVEKAVQVIEKEERKLDESYRDKLLESFKEQMKANNDPKGDSAIGPGGEK